MSTQNILIVDDDRDFVAFLERALSDTCPDFTIDVAESSSQCVAAIKSKPYTAVILDYFLGDRTADELIAFLQAQQPHCAFITISGSRSQDIAVEALKNGSIDFLNKRDALEPGVLRQRIMDSIKRHQEHHQERRRIQRRMNRLKDLAYRDPLTGLANRRAINELIVGNGRQIPDRRGDIAAVMIDIDFFKRVNDRYGHAGGDEVLRDLGRLLKAEATCTDACLRWGGEEFLILKFDSTQVEAMVFAEHLRKVVASHTTTFEDAQIAKSISVGVAATNASTFDQQTIDHADRALYFAKNHGRNRVCCWPQAEFNEVVEKLDHSAPDPMLQRAVNQFSRKLGAAQFEQVTSHAYAVAEMALTVGRELGFSKSDLIPLKDAGKYHDIGKIFVPDAVLAKPAALTVAERQVIDRHANDGAEVAELAGFDAAICDAIRSHHCRYDELGEDADADHHLGGQILQVADALTTMTTHRPYRAGCNIGDAMTELKRERGAQFSPRVVDATLAAFNSW